MTFAIEPPDGDLNAKFKQAMDAFRSMNNEQIREAIAAAQGNIVMYTIVAAAGCGILDERGVDVWDIDNDGRLLAIARGELIPELACDFIFTMGGKLTTVKLARGLPHATQKLLVSDQPFDIVERDEGGEFQIRKIRPSEWSQKQARQVLPGKGRAPRTLAEQRTYINEQFPARTAPPPQTPYAINKKARTLEIYGACSLTRKQVLSVLEELD